MCQVIMLYVSGRLACRIGSLMLTESGVEILALVQPFGSLFHLQYTYKPVQGSGTCMYMYA